MKKLKLGIIGSGFWADYQLAAWMEFKKEVEVVALCDRNFLKAKRMATKYNISHCYDNVETLLNQEGVDFVDIITDVSTHAVISKMAANFGIPIICQKPMADSLSSAVSMLQACRKAEVSLFIHENFRWQKPIRKVKELLAKDIIGKPFKARISYCSAFPVFKNQPSLAELEQFILTDIGSHILDVCRFLFGEAKTLYCQTSTVNREIKGEDVANVMMKMKNEIQCYAEMSYASLLEDESFPQTLLVVEGENGSIYLMKDFKIKIVTRTGTDLLIAKPEMYKWADPLYAPVHSSIADCNRNILDAIQGKGLAETTGDDNLNTVRLVWAAYESAKQNKVIDLSQFHSQKKLNLS